MTDKQKKIEKQYTLSDSSLNCYGFRLLTSGYQLAEYAKNPIGYYMHLRDGGVVVKWDELAINGDEIVAKPIINLSNQRGQQTVDEIESGFLNAASVGNIVVIEYTNDPEMMLPGQTGPTITKWYNKECSIVDIPGNSSALTTLYDKDNNVITLANLKSMQGGRSGLRVPNLKTDTATNDFPEELSKGFDELMKKGDMQKIKDRDYTLYAALMSFKFKSPVLETSRIDPERFKSYMAEQKRLRVKALTEMSVEELYQEDLMQELKELDSEAFLKKKNEYGKK